MVLCFLSQDIPSGQISDNTARRLLDGMGNMADAVSSVSSRPARMVAEWMSNQVAPKYWVPNNKITVCYLHNCITWWSDIMLNS